MKLQIELSPLYHIESKQSAETQFTKVYDLDGLEILGLWKFVFQFVFRNFFLGDLFVARALHRAGVIVERKTTSQTAIIVIFMFLALPKDSLRQIVSPDRNDSAGI